jgi:hypothetical protein
MEEDELKDNAGKVGRKPEPRRPGGKTKREGEAAGAETVTG